MRQFRNYIGGEWASVQPGRTFVNFNPADTREAVAEYPQSNAADVAAAIEAARAAYSAWAAMTPVARGRILGKASQGIEAQKDQLAQFLTREEGKTLAESSGEVQRAADIFRFFGGLGYTFGGHTIPHDLPGNCLYTRREPLGVVGLITPWNFPIAVPAWKLAPALLSGNTVVLKPATQAPAMALELARILSESGLPKGVLNVVTGDGRVAGAALAAHRASRRSRSPVRMRLATASISNWPHAWPALKWKWAARIPPWFWRMRIWIWPPGWRRSPVSV